MAALWVGGACGCAVLAVAGALGEFEAPQPCASGLCFLSQPVQTSSEAGMAFPLQLVIFLIFPFCQLP